MLFKVKSTVEMNAQPYDSSPSSVNCRPTKVGDYLTESECRARGIDSWNSRCVERAGESDSRVADGKRKKW